MKPEKSANESGPDPYSSKWDDLIGPEYAAIIRPYRKLILVGGVAIVIGLAAGIFWQSQVAHIPDWARFLGSLAFFFPGFATFTTGLGLQKRLSYKIDRDLWAVGVLPAKISPDLRNPSRFLYWSRHFGVTPEQVQAAGKRAAASRSGGRDPSVPNDEGLWDLTSKKRGDGGTADAE